MKANKLIIKILAVFILMISFCFTNQIHAVDLKYEANVTQGGIDATVRLYVKAHNAKSYDWTSITFDGTSQYGTNYSYSKNTFLFHGNYNLANYSTANNGGIRARYDTYAGIINATTENPDIMDSFGSQEVYVTSNSNTAAISIPWNGYQNTAAYQTRSKQVQKGDIYVNISDVYLTKSLLDEIQNKYNNASYISDGYIKIKMSFACHTYAHDRGVMLDGYTAIDEIVNGRDPAWMPYNRGYTNWNYDTASTGTSILNNYDNWLYIPLAKLNSRTLTVVHKVKDGNGNWYTEKTEEFEFGSDAYTYSKLDIGDNNKYYIGGKLSSGSTKDAAKANISNSTNNWGWNTTSKTIGASSNEEHYYIEMYYDYRNLSEYHLKTDGSVINAAWNKDARSLGWPLTKNDTTFNAKAPHVYYSNQKYVYVKGEYDNTNNKFTDTSLTFKALDGASSLVFGDAHYVKFFYEYEPPRVVYVRHFVYNESTGKYERSTLMTNSNAAIKDNEDGKYYLRANGFNQRKLKSGQTNYTDAVASGYNEMYTIDYDDTIKLDKSRTLENEGIQYVYKGYRVNDSTAPKVLTKAQANTTLDSTQTKVTLTAKEVTKTYVDFYYTTSTISAPGGETDDPDGDIEGSPTIDFVPKDDNGTNIGPDSATQTGDCKVTYVPSDENLKAYITASTYRPYSLIYDGYTIDSTTGDISYKLKKYDVYKLVSGAIQNNNNSNYGYINSTDKKGVFNTNYDTAVTPIANNINQAAKDSISAYQEKNPLTLTVTDGRKTVESDFGNSNIHEVKYDKYNGVRNPSGIARYNVVSLVSNGTEVFNVKPNSTVTVNTKNNTQVNVYTPVTIKEIIIESEKTVNHSNQDTFVIQKNSEFKITPVTDKTTDYNSINDTVRYVKYYWLVTDFDIKLVNTQTVYDKASGQNITMYSGQIVKAGNLIKIPRYGSFSGIATNEEDTGDIVNQFSNKVKVVAVTHNVTDDDFENKILSNINATTSYSLVDPNKTLKNITSCESVSTDQAHKSIGSAQVNSMYDDAHYFVAYTQTSKNIGRVYDFKITDCLDINLKNIFRKSNDGTVNDLRGIKYFSGLRRLLVYGGSGVQLGANQSNNNNIFEEREGTDTSLNSVVSKTILPFGPYKHIDTNYIQAPKLGYRISFDLKTSGAYFKESTDTSVRYIKITPSYYYISKDGKTFKENINLYYKNSSGKYVNFEGSGYTIYFKPNDGYRTVYNTDAPELKDMSTKLEALKIGGTSTDKSFILTDNMMSYSDNNFVQAWYGEFKLPNSTIVVEVDENGKKDINNPLTDGYIGVRFDIKCVDKETASTPESEATIVSYNLNDKTATEEGMISNTSQWDYEGYLGFSKSNIGSDLNDRLRIQLEKGFWEINTQSMYDKIKSTVVLYDTDNRAADDFS